MDLGMQRRKIKQIGQDRDPVIYLFAALEAELCENGTFKEETQWYRINHR